MKYGVWLNHFWVSQYLGVSFARTGKCLLNGQVWYQDAIENIMDYWYSVIDSKTISRKQDFEGILLNWLEFLENFTISCKEFIFIPNT